MSARAGTDTRLCRRPRAPSGGGKGSAGCGVRRTLLFPSRSRDHGNFVLGFLVAGPGCDLSEEAAVGMGPSALDCRRGACQMRVTPSKRVDSRKESEPTGYLDPAWPGKGRRSN